MRWSAVNIISTGLYVIVLGLLVLGLVEWRRAEACQRDSVKAA